MLDILKETIIHSDSSVFLFSFLFACACLFEAVFLIYLFRNRKSNNKELERIQRELSRQIDINYRRKATEDRLSDPEIVYSLRQDIRRYEYLDEEIALMLRRLTTTQIQLQDKIDRIDVALTSSGVFSKENESEAVVLMTQIANMTDTDYLLELLKDDTEKQHTLINNVISDLDHSIRTPLSGITTILMSIRAGIISDVEMKEYLSQIHQCVSQIEENMDVYRKILTQNTDTSAITTMGFVERLKARARITAISSGKQLNVDYQGETDIRLIPSVAERVLLAVSCIIENAATFANVNSTLRVISSIEEGLINIHIENDGNSIDSRYKDLIFNKGFSTRGSTGRGLYLVKRIVLDQLGGDVDFENISTPTNGVRFTIILDKDKCIAKERENDSDGEGINS